MPASARAVLTDPAVEAAVLAQHDADGSDRDGSHPDGSDPAGSDPAGS